MTASEIPPEVQDAYGLLAPEAGGSIVPLHSLINRTYLVTGDLGQGPQPMVLQARTWTVYTVSSWSPPNVCDRLLSPTMPPLSSCRS